MADRPIELVEVAKLKHIEGFSKKRAAWLKGKILAENLWRVPLKLDKTHYLVMDGQHRMEVARDLGLRFVPALLYDYNEVEVWSLRPENHEVSAALVIERSLAGNPYPYKTAKHAYPDGGDMECSYALEELGYVRA